MGCLLDQLPKPAVIAHRGASAFAPENTLAAFDLAITLQADAIELDAQLTADGHVVVFHDLTLQRTTNGAGKLHKKTLKELKTLDAGMAFDTSYQGQRIPTLDETLASFGEKTFFNIEIKNLTHPFNSLPEKVVQIVQNHNLKTRVLLSSFNRFALIKIHRILPTLPTGLLIKYPQGKVWLSGVLSPFIPHQSVHVSVKMLTKDMINAFHKSHRKVFAYTVNDPETIKKLKSWDIDGIFTDDPRSARQAFGEKD